MSPTITPHLWYTDDLFGALDFYTEVFGADAQVTTRIEISPQLSVAEFSLCGQQLRALQSARDDFGFNDAFSLMIDCADQAEVDKYWDALLAGGSALQCGWLIDRFGLRWQVIPRRLMELQADPNPARVTAVTTAMLTMVKLDVAALEAAANSVTD